MIFIKIITGVEDANNNYYKNPGRCEDARVVGGYGPLNIRALSDFIYSFFLNIVIISDATSQTERTKVF